MLGFDRARGCFLFEGVAIGPGIPAAPIAAALGAAVRPMPDAPDWAFLDLDSPALGASVSVLRGLVHSGHFWAHVPGVDGANMRAPSSSAVPSTHASCTR